MQNTMLDSTVSSNSQELPIASGALKLFENPQFRVRVIMRCAEPWFVAKDVATCIEHSDTSAMCKLCRDKDKVVASARDFDSDDLAESGNSRITLISEAGLYRILAKSPLPKCEPFESWVFDEVLPSVRKTGSYSVNQTQQQSMMCLPQDYESALEALLMEVRKNKALQAERDEAIRTKAEIGSRREATAMATASAKSRECEKLREQIGDSKTYKAAKAIPWLSEYFNTRNRGLYNSLAAKLKKLEAEMPPEFAHTKIADSQYGEIKAYHVAVIEKLHEMVQADEEFMKDYRKGVSPKTKNV